MKTNLKGFTLVELVVVITILSILSTLGFIGYSSYIISARDTARQSDLTILNNSLKTLSQKGFNLTLVVDTGSINNTGSGEFYFGGKNISLDSNYKAGAINYDYLKDISSPLFDPKTKNSYIIGVYLSNYELASFIEETKMSLIISSYKKRTSSGTIVSLTGSIDTINKSIELLNIEENIKFQIGDYVGTGSTNYKQVIDIIGEKIYLDDVSGISSIDKLRLFRDDTSLIGNSKIGVGVGTNCSNLNDLKANICPLKVNTVGLVPYDL